MRDFRKELAEDRFWDAETHAAFAEHGEPLVDCILQNREEVIGLCEFMEREGIRSYLEIGIWTGRLLCALQRIFRFERVAACDHGWAERCGFELNIPEGAQFFRGESGSTEFLHWRAALGHMDLVLIDANHRYDAVKRDFVLNSQFPHRFLAVHDILGANRHTVGVRRFWEEIDSGHKTEIVLPHRELGLDRSIMGLGIWSASLEES